MTRRFELCGLGATALILWGGLALGAAPAAVITLAVPDRANSTPWVAASGSFVAVVWGASAEGKGDVMLAVSRDGGGTFASPVRVNAVAGDARISGEIPPRVVLSPRRGGGDPIVAAVWNAKDGATAIRTAQSQDGGRTFSAPSSLQMPGAAGDRGWQAATLDGRGTLHAIWLDHRGLAADKATSGGAGHKGEHDGVAMAQKSGLYYASSANAGERELFKGVCYCCKTAMATGPKGEIYAAWRHVFAGNLRDIAFTASRDGGRTFEPLVRVHEDKWAIHGCPDDGPAMAVDASGTIHLVWPTVPNGVEGALHYAWSKDGRSFTPATRVPTLGTPKPSHPQIAVDGKGRVMVAWDEVVNGARTAAAREVTHKANGIDFGPIRRIDEAGSALYPVLAATDQGWLAVWTTGGTASTVRARLLSE
jgi:hypothetical protein